MAYAVAGLAAGRQRRALAQADGARLDVTFWQGVLLQFVNIKAWMLALSIAGGWIGAGPDWPRRC